MIYGGKGKNRGSAMVWAICLMLIVAALSAAILSSASYYNNSTLREESLRKARLTSLSAVDTVFAVMEGLTLPHGSYASAEEAYAALRYAHPWLPPVGGESNPRELSLDFGPSFGEVEALTFSCVNRGDGLYSITITADAVCDGQRQSRSLAATLEIAGPPYSLRWRFDAYQ